jgi:hypothetical protein
MPLDYDSYGEGGDYGYGGMMLPDLHLISLSIVADMVEVILMEIIILVEVVMMGVLRSHRQKNFSPLLKSPPLSLKTPKKVQLLATLILRQMLLISQRLMMY